MFGLNRLFVLGCLWTNVLFAAAFQNVRSYKTFVYPPDLWPVSVEVFGGRGANGYVIESIGDHYQAKMGDSCFVSLTIPFSYRQIPNASVTVAKEMKQYFKTLDADENNPLLENIFKNVSVNLGTKTLWYPKTNFIPLSLKGAVGVDYVKGLFASPNVAPRDLQQMILEQKIDQEQLLGGMHLLAPRFLSGTLAGQIGGNFFQLDGLISYNYPPADKRNHLAPRWVFHNKFDFFIPFFSFFKLFLEKIWSLPSKEQETAEASFSADALAWHIGCSITPLPCFVFTMKMKNVFKQWNNLNAPKELNLFSLAKQLLNIDIDLSCCYRIRAHRTLSWRRWINPKWVNILNSLPSRHLEALPRFVLLDIQTKKEIPVVKDLIASQE